MFRVLVAVSGHPGSGKSTLALTVSHTLALPLLSKDGVKEALFEGLGAADREWSRRLGGASWDLVYYMAGVLMAAARPFVLEGNFDPDRARPILTGMARRHGYRVLEVFCTAPPDVLQSRFRERALSGTRHPGHLDAQHLDEFMRRLEEPLRPLGIGPVLAVDTSRDDANTIGVRTVSWITAQASFDGG